MYESSSAVSSHEDLRYQTDLTTAPPSAMNMQTYERITWPESSSTSLPSMTSTAADLPSQVHSFISRAARLSSYLAHIAGLVEPLKKTGEYVDDFDLRNILLEGKYLRAVMQKFEEQLGEMQDVLEELEFEKRATRKAIGGEESGVRGWTGAKKGRYWV